MAALARPEGRVAQRLLRGAERVDVADVAGGGVAVAVAAAGVVRERERRGDLDLRQRTLGTLSVLKFWLQQLSSFKSIESCSNITPLLIHQLS